MRRADNAFYYAIKKHRDWAMSRLKGNRAGLKDRLLELVTLANSGAVQHLLTDVETWAKWVKNARNAIGHLNPGELEKKIPLKMHRTDLSMSLGQSSISSFWPNWAWAAKYTAG